MARFPTFGLTSEFDLVTIYEGDLDQRELLLEMVLISLFSWGRASAADGEERHGWWGAAVAVDVPNDWGSRLWQLENETVSTVTPTIVESMCSEALQWMIDQGVASSVDVSAEIVGSRVPVVITIDGSEVARWADIWEALSAGK